MFTLLKIQKMNGKYERRGTDLEMELLEMSKYSN